METINNNVRERVSFNSVRSCPAGTILVIQIQGGLSLSKLTGPPTYIGPLSETDPSHAYFNKLVEMPNGKTVGFLKTGTSDIYYYPSQFDLDQYRAVRGDDVVII